MAARRSPLRAVEPGEAPEKRMPKTIAEAAEDGDRLAELRLMRRRIARALDDDSTPARDLAALSRRQIEIGKEIDSLMAREREEAGSGAEVSDGEFSAEAI